jgi:type II secretory ATPase GspE/PulE/Tfp pilus assembly ATPase PilB-like protein
MAEHEDRLGTLLVRDKVVTQYQLNHALQVQKEQEEREKLGMVLVRLGYLTHRRLRDTIKKYGRRKLFGEILVEDGTLSREQLKAALAERKTTGQLLGKLLLEKGALSEDKVAQTLSQQLDIPYVVPHANMVDMNVFGRLPERFVQTNSIIPASERDGVVTVLVADPTNLKLMFDLEDVFGASMEVCVCSKARIDKTIETLVRQKRLDGASAGDKAASGELLLDGKLLFGREAGDYVRSGSASSGLFDFLIYNALHERASDIHIEPQRDRVRVRYRIDGVLLFRTDFPLDLAQPIASRAKVLANLDPVSLQQQQEGRLLAHADDEEVDLRVTVTKSVFGEAIAIRIFAKQSGMYDLAELGMLPAVLTSYRRMIRRGSGVTLFVGPTGVGKTTSLYATLALLNDGTSKIVTVEAPVEFPMDGVIQTNLSSATPADLVRAFWGILHQDPDIIALGETTTEETAYALLESALMGHKVFSTLHAEDSASALVRLEDVREAANFLASCSLVIVAQRLVRKICEHCSEVYVPPLEVMERFQVRDLDPDTIDVRRGVGCAECLGTGFKGRVGMFEVLQVGEEMRDALLAKRSADAIRQITHGIPSFITLRQAGFLKAVQGLTTLEEVLRVTPAVELSSSSKRSTLDDLCSKAGLSLEGTVERDENGVAAPASDAEGA